MQSTFKKYFGTQEKIKLIFKLFLPAALQAAISIAVLYVDNFALSTLLNINGEEAKTALGLANPSMSFVIMYLFGWLGGTSIMMSQYFGAKDYSNTQKISFYRIWSLTLLTVPAIVLFMVIPQDIIQITSNPDTETLKHYATIYLSSSAWTFIPFAIAAGLSTSLQETKRTNVSFLAAGIGMLTNVILDPIVIMLNRDNPEAAIAFVALSTGIARIVQCLVILIYISNKKNDPINFYHNWTISRNLLFIVNKKGMSVFINDLVFSMANLLIMISLLVFNTKYQDAMTNLQLMIQFTTVIWPGMATACAVLIGSELGNNKIDEAKNNARILITWGIVLASVFSLMLFFTSFWVNPILSPGSSDETIRTSMFLQWTIIPIILSQGIFSILYYAIRSGGSKLVILIDAGVMVIWVSIFSTLTFLGYFEDMNPCLYLFMMESNQIAKAILAYIIYKTTNWAISLTSVDLQENEVMIKNEFI